MTPNIAGIDPHQNTFTVGIVDEHGIELSNATFDSRAAGYIEAVELLNTHSVEQVGIEGSGR